MKVNAVYHQDTREDGTVIHAVDHDNGGFLVSSQAVGIAVQDFLNSALPLDIYTLHGHLLYAFERARKDEEVAWPESGLGSFNTINKP